MTKLFLGFAPVSALSTGWCILRTAENGESSEHLSGISTSVNKALAIADQQLPDTPDTIGIAAPLYWTTKDDREADRILRGLVLSLGAKSATVPALPAVPGAKITGGIMLAAKIRQYWPAAPITEAAPKALLIMDAAANALMHSLDMNSDAEKHAALAAYTALAYHEQRRNWHDLRQFDKDIFEPVVGIKAAFWLPATAC